jgi:hypothetical protein
VEVELFNLEWGLNPFKEGIQGAFQTSIPVPLLILQQNPLAKADLELRIDCHIQEDPLLFFTSQKDFPLRYLAETYLTHGLSSFVATLHPSLAKRAAFISLNLLIPNPPALLGTHINIPSFKINYSLVFLLSPPKVSKSYINSSTCFLWK